MPSWTLVQGGSTPEDRPSRGQFAWAAFRHQDDCDVLALKRFPSYQIVKKWG